MFATALVIIWQGCVFSVPSDLASSPSSQLPGTGLSMPDSSLSSSFVSPPMRISPSFPNSLRVNPDRLWQSLEAIVRLDDRFSVAGRTRTRSFLVDQLTDLGWDVERQGFPEAEGLTAENLIATKTWGNASNRALKRWVVGAHYDTVWETPGADDNGTGIAVLLELAHLFADVSWEPLQPVRLDLIFFDLEERGLQGSFAYTQRPENLEQLQGAIVLEMMGYTCTTPGCQQYPKNLLIEPPSDRGDFLGVVGDAEHPEMLVAFSAAAQAESIPSDLRIFTLSVPLKGVLTPDVLRSDHSPFWLQNIGAVMVTDTANLRNPHYHQPTDTLETLDRTFFTQSSQAVVNALLYYLSRAGPE